MEARRDDDGGREMVGGAIGVGATRPVSGSSESPYHQFLSEVEEKHGGCAFKNLPRRAVFGCSRVALCKADAMSSIVRLCRSLGRDCLRNGTSRME